MSDGKAIKRTSHGLVETLFDTIDSLNKREIDSEHARAVAHTARAIVGVASLELEFRKLEQKTPLTSLAIEAR